MKFFALFIYRPVATILISLAITLCGVLGFRLLPVAPLPQVDFPVIMVSASLPGASPETMASSVATPLERSLGRIAGVNEMTSSSSLGSTRIILEFNFDRDINGAARDVQAAINAAQSLLPSGMPSRPTYRKANPSDAPIMILTLTSETYSQGEQSLEFTPVRKLILVIFALAFAVMIYGVAVLGWWMAEISAVFLASAIIVGLIARMSEEELTSTFINGARDLLGVALIIGIARGIVVIMDKGMITHTILHSAEGMVTGLSTVAFINVMYWLEVVLSFLVPSSSGLAVLTMPIMAPLADFANVNRDLVVTAYQSASGIVNLITPTSAVVMGGLAIARVPYVRYLKWVAPLLGILTVVIMVALSLGALL